MCTLAGAHSLANPIYISLGFASRVVSGVALAFVMTVCMLYTGYSIVSTDYADTINAAISGLETSSGLGLMLGPIFASLIYDTVGFAVIFYGYAVMLVAIVPIFSFIQTGQSEDEEGGGRVTVWKLLSYREILLTCMVVVFTLSTNGFLDAYLGPHLIDIGLRLDQVGYIFACYNVTYTLIGITLSKLLKRIKLKTALASGILFTIAGLCLIGPVPYLPKSIITVACGLGFMGAGMALSFRNLYLVPMLPYIIDTAEKLGVPLEDNLCNAVSSVCATSYSLGEILGPSCGGLLLSAINFMEVGVVLSFLGATLVLAFILLRRNSGLSVNSSDSSQFMTQIHTSLFSPNSS